ncbi:MAG: serine/threonine-protein phosphatase [Gammaproteobacteria bacterium]|nr:serine/threonine-protein phosphatase [Gammaproteobacteria bacterium]
MKLHTSCISDVGQKRSLNEDCGLVDDNLGLLLVADGMGGHGSGDVASQLTAAAVKDFIKQFLEGKIDNSFFNSSEPTPLEHDADSTIQALPNPVFEVVSAAVKKANSVVYEQNKRRGFADGSGMGTTLAGIWKLGALNEIVLFQVGDSRIYLYRDKKLLQLTRDHTAYQEWERNGRTGPAPPQNLILRAIGLFKDVSPDVRTQSVHPGDVLIVCSDGLTSMLDDKEIEEIVTSKSSQLGVMGAVLVKAANEKGGDDNITVVAGRFAEQP